MRQSRTLAPTHGTKYSAPVSIVNDAKIAELSKRIHQLEDALQISHDAVSSAPHPLLAEDLLQIKSGETLVFAEKDEDVADANLADQFGTLAVSNGGAEVYYGYTGPTHDVLTRKLVSSEIDAQAEPHLTLPPHVSYLSKTFPFTPLYLPVPELQECIEEMLPPYTRATALVEAYLTNLSWFFRPVEREEIMEELIPIVYKRKRPPSVASRSGNSPNDSYGGQARTDPHALGLLLSIFAVGAVADMTLPPWNDEGELYYQLSRTALSLKPVFEGAGLHAVEAIALLAAYNLFSCRRRGLEGTWKILSFSLSLAASIGLNRDPAHFNLPPKVVQRRRRAFWELHSMDLFRNNVTGRPATFPHEVIDCELPEDNDSSDFEGRSEKLDSIWQIRYRYLKEILTEISDKLGAMRTVKYSEILSLDQKIRQYDPQGILRLPIHDLKSDGDLGIIYRQMQLSMFKDTSLLLLHRSFFARALIEDPTNPVRTRFGPSFLSMYRAAASMVHFVRKQFDQEGLFLLRCWPILAQALHATVILGSVAACGTASALAPQAYIHFNLAYEMFTRAPMHPVINASVPIVTRLREQALEALAKHGHDISSQISPINSQPNPKSYAQDFNSTATLGRLVKKSFDGEFGTAPAILQNLGRHPGLSTTAQSNTSSASQSSMPFTGVSGAYARQGDTSSPLSTLPHRNLANDDVYHMETDTDSFHAVAVESGQEHSFEKESVGNPSDGRTDAHVAESGSSGNQLFNSDPFDFSGSSIGANSDVFSTYTTFSDSLGDGSLPGPSSGTVDDASKLQSDAPTFRGDPFLFNTPSPGRFFTSDFDVSFDMRASSGQESVLPLLPQDMEAWRTILQDSRFFGFTGENTDSEKGTPR
ncbi:hypothetical protein A7U60_g5682 [Sanghuangporus baumii]|uniref:Xylanolytic transcriptional activator regulatory domain-containing protein n=1 Tax=Sanghuangporus baumii TaxID=108892 RepID=A0A9Q5N350_SANBA|nr:hypothetical protein A7U60_g5682 [Sanghuangporus baumii]